VPAGERRLWVMQPCSELEMTTYDRTPVHVSAARRCPLLLISLGALLLGALPGRAVAQGGAGGDTSGLLAEMVAGWQRLEQIDDETKTCRIRYTITAAKGEPTQVEARLGVGDGTRLFASDRLVYVSSPWYGFLLQRADPAREEWTLASFLNPDQLNDPKLRDNEHHPLKAMSQCFRPLSAYGTGGQRLAKMAEVSAIQVEKVEPGEGSLLVVTYTSRYKKSTGKTFEQVRMVVDRDASYCPVEITRKNTAQPSLLIEERRTLASKQPVRCGSYTYRLTNNQALQNEVALTFSDYSDRPPPNEELRLYHYGLPDPVGVELPPRRTPIYVWILAAAAGFGVLALLFRWLMRRRQAAAGAA
jgi:hypothetical protein